MVDPRRLRTLLARLEEEMSHLRRLASYEENDLMADADRLAAVKYRFVVAIEICIDAGQHIISSERLGDPQDFAGVFELLGENGFVSEADVPALRSMAGFRNVLVHGYAIVDDQRVLAALSRLDDIERFSEQIARSALGA
jgi:uncharacterized protein YutE (UPF0331/DUF86 family)